MKKQNKDQEKLLSVVYTILEDRLTPQHRDHALKGNWAGHRECHIEGDWVLVYRFESSTLVLVDTGSHAEVFKGKY